MTDLSTPKAERGGGFERATFEIDPRSLTHFMRRNQGIDPESFEKLLKGFFCNLYTVAPRPIPEDILKMEVSVPKVTLTIRRGHFAILQLIQEYEVVRTIKAKGQLRIELWKSAWGLAHPSDPPDRELVMPLSAFPKYDWNMLGGRDGQT